MSIIAIDHVQLAMPAACEERARVLSRRTGPPEKPKPPDLAARGGCWFENDRVKIHLGVDKDFRPATKAHPALLVRDLQGIVDRCRERGLAVVEDAPLGGYRRVFVNDPFGNRLELMEKT